MNGASRTLPAASPALDGLERTVDAGSDLIDLKRLNRNERLAPLPEAFVEGIRNAITGSFLTMYPMTDELYAELSAATGIAEDRLLVTPGSDGALKATFHAYLRPGDTVVSLTPSYAMYRVYAQMFQAESVEVGLQDDLLPDMDELLAAIGPGVRIVAIANPNQPTGRTLPEADLVRVIERAGEVGALVALDEAYFPFSKLTMLERTPEFDNLLVIRTFSKAAGLAGLRVGLVAGHPELVRPLRKVRSAYDVNAMAILGVRELLRHPEVMDDYVAMVDAGKAQLAERARALGLEPYETHANFLLIGVARKCAPADLVAALRERDWLVGGPFGAPCVSDCIRVTLGPAELMREFATALEDTLASLAAGAS